MAKSQSRKEVIELREMEDLTTSIGRGMDNLAEKSERHLDVLTNSTDMMKKIVDEMEDSEGLAKSINALKQKEKELTKENWGLNEDLKNELLNQVTAAKEALSIEQKRRDVVDEVAKKAEDFGSAMTEQLNGLKSSLAEINSTCLSPPSICSCGLLVEQVALYPFFKSVHVVIASSSIVAETSILNGVILI